MPDIPVILGLLVAVVALATLAGRVHIPYPILLVIGGAMLALVPELPPITLAPELVFLLFVPPLVYAAAVLTSWRDLVSNARPIALLAIGLVFATMAAVAVVAHAAIPGFDWPSAFVLGAVVANTDTVAVEAIAKRLRLPRRAMTVLSGEALLNDAVSLVAFRLAVAATVSGAFSPWEAGADFVLAGTAAVAIGIAVGALTDRVLAFLVDPPVWITAGLLAPFVAYLPADRLGASGILAAVAAGLYAARRRPWLGSPTSRLQAAAIWQWLVFVLNGLLFILVGLQLRPIWEELADRQPVLLVRDAVLVLLAVVLVRFAWVFAFAYLSRWAIPGLAKQDPYPGWRFLAVVAWAGLRGADTLAAALAIPYATGGGAPFPARSLIIFLAFVVILATLVGQGLTLPPMIRRLGLVGDTSAEAREEALAWRAATTAALARIDELTANNGAPADVLAELREHYSHRATILNDDAAEAVTATHVTDHKRLRRDVLSSERRAVRQLRQQGVIADEVWRRLEHAFDQEETRAER